MLLVVVATESLALFFSTLSIDFFHFWMLASNFSSIVGFSYIFLCSAICWKSKSIGWTIKVSKDIGSGWSWIPWPLSVEPSTLRDDEKKSLFLLFKLSFLESSSICGYETSRRLKELSINRLDLLYSDTY